MTEEETKQSEQARDATPGDIGDYIDQESLASKLMDAVDRACDRAEILGILFHEIQTADNLTIDLFAFETICNDISTDLSEAHKMICDPQNYPEWKGISHDNRTDH